MPNGGYGLTSKGRSFLVFMENHYQFITDDWYRDLCTWRSIPKDNLKDTEGNWLPQPKFIKAIEAMKWHRLGTKRQGSHAGRPALYKHCPLCHGIYGLDITECPLCRIKAEQAARAQQGTPVQAPPELKPAVKLIEQQCPTCDGPTERVRLGWYCQKCDITLFSTGG
jgi:hypothetical protein